MSNEEKKNIFAPICQEIIDVFGEERLVPHKWFKKKFGIEQPDIKDFDDTGDFLKEVNDIQFRYMGLMVDLQDVMLRQYPYCLRNIPGEGYMIIAPTDQAQFGYDWFVNEIQKAVRKASAILTYIKPVGSEQAAKNADLLAKLGRMKSMFKQLK